MSIRRTVTFQEALDVVESLPTRQQENLIDVLRRRLIDHRKKLLADNVRKAKREYASGEVNKGTVDDLMKDL